MDKKWVQILLIAILLFVTVIAIIFYNKSNLRQNELESRNLTIEQLKKEVAALKTNIEQLQKKIDQAVEKNKALADENRHIPQLEKQLGERNRDLDAALEQARKLSVDLQTFTAISDETRSQLEDMTADYTEALDRIEHQRSEIKSRDAALQQLKSELRSFGEAKKSAETRFQEEIAGLKTQLGARTGERDAAQMEAQKLGVDLQSVTLTRDEIRTRLEELDADLAEALARNEQQRSEIESRDEAVQRLETELVALGKAKQAVETQFSEGVAGLETQIAEQTRDIDTIRRRVRQLETDLQGVTSMRDKIQVHLEKMTARLKAALDQIAQQQSALETKDASIEKLESAHQVDLKKVQYLKDSLTKKGAELTDLNQQLSLIEQEKENTVKSAMQLQKTYDELLNEFGTEISNREATIKDLQEKLKVTLIDDILFNLGEASISAQGKSTLKKIGNIMQKVEGNRIVIAGHTDNVPIKWAVQDKFPTNWELSSARATAVVRFFQNKIGLDPARMEAVGHSFYKPVVDNTTKENRAQNRRVEIFIIPE